MKGELWGLLWKIIMGNYPNSRTGASDLPIKLQTNSPLDLIPGMDPEEATALMQRVLDGTLKRGQLRNECLRRQCFEDTRRHMMEVINAKTMSAGQVKKGKMTVATWADVEEKYPRLAAPAFLEG